ncbi:hypothetical protein LVJ94_34950 [Pendulispora rubella]|uniref:Uncharacterized protein n=1 Tax=Pendulispora rubella TaxID=2741070 RepID=A0ABZ2KYN3_9BACT
MSSLPLSSEVALAILGDAVQLLAVKEAALTGAPGAMKMPPAGDWLSRAKGKLSGGLGAKGNLVLAGGTLGAGLLASKGLRATTQHMSGEARPQVFGADPESLGYRLPVNVNAYGVPQNGPR